MVGKIRTIALLSVLCLFPVWTGSARAGIEPVPWAARLASGLDNPLFWLMFDPQPEPPGYSPRMSLDASVPTAPVFEINSTSGGQFVIEFALQNLSSRISDFRLVRETNGFAVSALGLAGPLYTARFSFESGKALLAVGSDVMFDPQPEPPGLPGFNLRFSLLHAATGAPVAEGSEILMTLGISAPGGSLMSLSLSPVSFVRGDADADGAADLSDAVAILRFLFLGSPKNDCSDAADVNDDGTVDISDPVRLLGYLFLGSERPPDPFTACGADPTSEDALGCITFRACP